MRITGLDLSLTGTGVVRYDTQLARAPQCRTFGTKPAGDLVGDRSVRLRSLVTMVWPYLQDSDLVVIEGPSLGSSTPHTHDRSGLWWMLVGRLTGKGIPVVEVAPATLKVYALGKGRGDKDMVLAAVVRRYLDVSIANNNEADALMLCLMGARSVGAPYDPDLPQTHTRAMAAPAWPNR